MSGRRRPRAQKKRAGKPRTLRTRLVVASVTLIAVVCAVIGTVTTVALKSHLYEQLESKVTDTAVRAVGRPQGSPEGGPGPANPNGSSSSSSTSAPMARRFAAIAAIRSDSFTRNSLALRTSIPVVV